MSTTTLASPTASVLLAQLGGPVQTHTPTQPLTIFGYRIGLSPILLASTLLSLVVMPAHAHPRQNTTLTQSPTIIAHPQVPQGIAARTSECLKPVLPAIEQYRHITRAQFSSVSAPLRSQTLDLLLFLQNTPMASADSKELLTLQHTISELRKNSRSHIDQLTRTHSPMIEDIQAYASMEQISTHVQLFTLCALER